MEREASLFREGFNEITIGDGLLLRTHVVHDVGDSHWQSMRPHRQSKRDRIGAAGDGEQGWGLRRIQPAPRGSD